ncbi:acetyl/propionyl/methylcrotonyl-CoA carboxylase subunit alpha [Afifella pfennigii]|uniref:acetyl/propionyl/methylcrotonyl-CoA carboxylase subunit alpha n=1 Tax=Afifella pfennigii TaxID=209897 RepID=UPI00068C4A6E|nr:biotin carboxylase N-terminal domain-containing protein [Afifella pfennigii]
MTAFLTAPFPIRTVVIANRGEIACRIIATCRRLGLRTVAVYSDADAEALHVRLADEAHRLGPAAPSESYLCIEAVLAAARASGADAVHPGYGFLSENAAFVEACAEAGFIFIGPSADAVRSMGSKIEARRIAAKAGVPVVPGFEGAGASNEELIAAAERIGFPVMVKASAGGGGRGMRRVESAEALAAALASAQAEAGSAFGDDTVFLEKLIGAPRHLEVQVFGDGRGGARHFHERDCSVQRNHQKVIEEAPAPNLADAIRERLFASALKLTRAIDYAGAGTVEFIMEAGSGEPYFLEMNTRLQVEHPVTEAICGVDLVELQLRQAAGLPLNLSQEQIVTRGHAIEVRINAERPDCGFLPATGRFLDVVPPSGLRFDSGVAAGSEVGTSYDSMLAKLIAYGVDRDTARKRLIAGLEALAMPGVPTNQAFLADCLRADAFAEKTPTTAFLQEAFPEGWHPDANSLLRLRGRAAAVLIAASTDSPLHRTDGFRVTRPRRTGTVPLHVEDEYGQADLALCFGAGLSVESGPHSLALKDEPPAVWRQGELIHAVGEGLSLSLTARPLAEARLSARTEDQAAGQILAPLTGLVTKVHVATGDRVKSGDPLLEMEAMKLVHTLAAPFDGIVAKVACAAGDTHGAKTILIEMEEAA